MCYSKRIASLGADAVDGQSAAPAVLQLQKMVRMSTSMFLQRKVVGLENPPTEAEVTALREARLYEAQQRVEIERAAVIASTTRLQSSPVRGRSAAAHAVRDGVAATGSPAEGWTPTAAPRIGGTQQSAAAADPVVQQMNNIRGYLAQARAAQKWDEVRMLETNLRELDLHWRSTR